LIADWAAGVRTFVWLISGATDGNESDDFGMLHDPKKFSGNRA